MEHKKRTTKRLSIQTSGEQTLLLAINRLEERLEVPCDVDPSMPGLLI